MTADPDYGKHLFAEFVRTRDPSLRDEIVQKNMGLAVHLARRFENRGVPRDDLIQVASLALVNAVDRYDPARGLEFSTFATPTILGELKRHFRDRGWAMRVPRRLKELHIVVGQTVEQLTQQLDRAPTIPEIADRAGISDEEVISALEVSSAYRTVSIDQPAGGDDDRSSLAELIGEPDPELTLVDVRDQLDSLISVLPPREQLMIHLRFFENMTQAEIAERLGVSQMQVSRLLDKSLSRMRAAARP